VPRKLLPTTALVALVVIAYLPALTAGFIWNDDTYLTANRTLDGFGGLRLVWTSPRANEQFYPMVFTTFWLEKRLWGLDPFGYHLVNVLLHAGSALLLWRLLARMGLAGAWLAAAAFALHPVCVESVAWITERKNTLSLFLSLLSWHAWSSFLEARGDAGSAPRTRRVRFLYAAALGLFVLALLAKTTASVLPFVLLVLAWRRKGRVELSDALPLVPFFAIGTGLGLHTAWLERTSVLATGKEWGLSVPGRLALAGQTAAFYAAKLFAPVDLAFVYRRWRVDPRVLAQWLPTACVVLAAVAAWFLRGRFGRWPFAVLLLFLGAVFPAMGFFNVYPMRFSWVADHFAYQAAAVFAAGLVCGGAAWAAGRAPGLRWAGVVAGIVVMGLLGTLTFRESRLYRDEGTLWAATLAKNHECFICETNYGIWLREQGREAEAESHLRASFRLNPDEVPTLLNLAQLVERRGDFEDSASLLRAALRADPRNAAALLNLAKADVRAGRFDDAAAHYREALRVGSPGDALAHNGLGAVLMQRGEAVEAIAHFREALRLDPGYEHARANLERALADDARKRASSGASRP
jgi:tetratricopeptide (TPR) repeat protein